MFSVEFQQDREDPGSVPLFVIVQLAKVLWIGNNLAETIYGGDSFNNTNIQ